MFPPQAGLPCGIPRWLFSSGCISFRHQGTTQPRTLPIDRRVCQAWLPGHLAIPGGALPRSPTIITPRRCRLSTVQAQHDNTNPASSYSLVTHSQLDGRFTDASLQRCSAGSIRAFCQQQHRLQYLRASLPHPATPARRARTRRGVCHRSRGQVPVSTAEPEKQKQV